MPANPKSKRTPFPRAPLAIDKRTERALRAIRDDDRFVGEVAHLRAVHATGEDLAGIQPGVILAWLEPHIASLRGVLGALLELEKAKSQSGWGEPVLQTSGVPGFQRLLMEVATTAANGEPVPDDALFTYWPAQLYKSWRHACMEPYERLEEIAWMLEQVRDRLRAMKKRGRPRKYGRRTVLRYVDALAVRYALTGDERARVLAAVFPGLSPATIEPPARIAAVVGRKRTPRKMPSE